MDSVLKLSSPSRFEGCGHNLKASAKMTVAKDSLNPLCQHLKPYNEGDYVIHGDKYSYRFFTVITSLDFEVMKRYFPFGADKEKVLSCSVLSYRLKVSKSGLSIIRADILKVLSSGR